MGKAPQFLNSMGFPHQYFDPHTAYASTYSIDFKAGKMIKWAIYEYNDKERKIKSI